MLQGKKNLLRKSSMMLRMRWNRMRLFWRKTHLNLSMTLLQSEEEGRGDVVFICIA